MWVRFLHLGKVYSIQPCVINFAMETNESRMMAVSITGARCVRKKKKILVFYFLFFFSDAPSPCGFHGYSINIHMSGSHYMFKHYLFYIYFMFYKNKNGDVLVPWSWETTDRPLELITPFHHWIQLTLHMGSSTLDHLCGVRFLVKSKRS